IPPAKIREVFLWVPRQAPCAVGILRTEPTRNQFPDLPPGDPEASGRPTTVRAFAPLTPSRYAGSPCQLPPRALTSATLRVSAPPRFKNHYPPGDQSHQSTVPRYARRRSICQIDLLLIGSSPAKFSGSVRAPDMLAALALALSA